MEYSLDGENNVTIAGNTTLIGLSAGTHNVTVYAWDDAGNVGASDTVSFSVADSESFSHMLVIAVSMAAAAIVVVGTLVYRKKRERCSR